MYALSFSAPKIRLLRSLTIEQKNSVQVFGLFWFSSQLTSSFWKVCEVTHNWKNKFRVGHLFLSSYSKKGFFFLLLLEEKKNFVLLRHICLLFFPSKGLLIYKIQKCFRLLHGVIYSSNYVNPNFRFQCIRIFLESSLELPFQLYCYDSKRRKNSIVFFFCCHFAKFCD